MKVTFLVLLAVLIMAAPAQAGECAAFNGGYEADVSLFPNAPLPLCDPAGVEPGKKCLYMDKSIPVTIEEVVCADASYTCCMEVKIQFSTIPIEVQYTNLCYDITTNGPNTMAKCAVAFSGNIGTGTDYYKLVGGEDQLTVTSKTGNDPNNAALGLINGKRVSLP